MVLNTLMENGLKVERRDKSGKTIIFAKSHKHVQAIVERFNILYPNCGSSFAKVIDYSINYVDTLIDDFSDKNKLPQITVSVDMLDTGIDIPEILNLVFFKKVRTLSVNEIKEHISSLIIPLNEDELAKRFDNVIYTIELANLQGNNATKPIKSVIETAEELSKLGTIPEIQAQKYIIENVKTEEFWEDVDIFELDTVREALRELLKYLQKDYQKIYYTDFQDFIICEESHSAMYNANELKNYRKKVEHYLKEHKDEMAIYKLRNNKRLTKQDLKSLEDIMWTQLGTHADYEKEFGEMPINKLVRKIVGLDRQSANEAFSEFLNNESLNMKQIHFVKLIVDYIVANGFIDDNRILQEDPFRSVGSIIELFKDKVDDARKIMGIIEDIKRNSEEVV